ncbi:MAG TPA: S53 family peptidase, partial [Acidimicrobiales bacterium]
GLSAGAKSTTGAKPDYPVNGCSSMETALTGAGYVNGTNYYSYDALSSIYGMIPVVGGGNDGAGVTVAVFELENYDPTGVAELDSCYGYSTSVSEIKVDGGPGTAPANLYTGVGFESALDIETIANLAPGVKILDYAAPNTSAGVVANYQAIVNQDTAQVVSTSWGLCEPDAGSSTVAQENTVFQQAAVQGQTVVAASGDEGDTECYGDGSSALEVQDPSSQPYVTGVGGTTMQGLTNPSQSTWNDVTGNGYGASGGGVSSDFGLPSYQSGASATGYFNCTAASGGCRQVPDVSALANPNDGYVIDEYFNDKVKGDQVGDSLALAGGTSGAAPVWAAVFALTDATTTCRLNGEAGFVNPSLYTAGEGTSASSVFSDVTTGDNGISEDGAPYAYPATSGYDMATGWGSPKIAGVMASVCQAPIVSAASYFVNDGPTRVMDTRPGRQIGPVLGPVGGDKTITLPLSGVANVPTSDVSAVVLNVTAIQPGVAGNATVYPDGDKRPLASNLNWTPGETIPNLVVVPVTDGSVDIYNNSAGSINYAVDVEGYFTTDATAAGVSSYTPFGPVRVADTRSNHKVGTVVGPLAGSSTTGLQVAGQQGLPASGMSAVVMNVTVTAPTSSGNITVFPSGTTQPTSSNLNYKAGESIPNLVIVPLGSDGKVDLYNNSGGSVQYIIDVAGYFTAGTAGAKY